MFTVHSVYPQFIDLGSVMALGSMDSSSPGVPKKEPASSKQATAVSNHASVGQGVNSAVASSANHTSSVVSQGLATLNNTSTAQVLQQQHNTGVNPSPIAVVSAPGTGPPKTIVVVPVSANSSDGSPAIKRIKTN